MTPSNKQPFLTPRVAGRAIHGAAGTGSGLSAGGCSSGRSGGKALPRGGAPGFPVSEPCLFVEQIQPQLLGSRGPVAGEHQEGPGPLAHYAHALQVAPVVYAVPLAVLQNPVGGHRA